MKFAASSPGNHLIRLNLTTEYKVAPPSPKYKNSRHLLTCAIISYKDLKFRLTGELRIPFGRKENE